MNIDLAQVFGELGLPFLSLLALLGLALVFSAYVKLITVFSILRLGLGGSALPSLFVTGAISLSLTLFIMYPVLQRSAQAAYGVLREAGTTRTEEVRFRAIGAAAGEWRGFLKRQADDKLVGRFAEIAHRIDTGQETAKKAGAPVVVDPALADSWRVLAPAFMVSQLKQAFSVGLSIILPFLLVDIIVVTILGALGLERLEPGYVGLPAKLLLFVLADGWTLVTTNLVLSYQ